MLLGFWCYDNIVSLTTKRYEEFDKGSNFDVLYLRKNVIADFSENKKSRFPYF